MTPFESEISPGLKRLLDPSHKKHVENVLKDGRNELGRKINNKIKEKGFVPRDTGKLADSHRVVSDNDVTYIVSNRRVSNGVPLWIYITGGHRTIKRKDGTRGCVPPNDYHSRAVAATSVKKIYEDMIRNLLK